MKRTKKQQTPAPGGTRRKAKGMVQIPIECTPEERDAIAAAASAARQSRNAYILSQLLGPREVFSEKSRKVTE